MIVADGAIVGWVDYDPENDWLGPGEVNLGYNVFAPYRRRGYASRALRLLLGVLIDHTDYDRAYLVIDAENSASHRVARTVGARPVPDHARKTGHFTSVHYVVELGEGEQGAARPGPR